MICEGAGDCPDMDCPHCSSHQEELSDTMGCGAYCDRKGFEKCRCVEVPSVDCERCGAPYEEDEGCPTCPRQVKIEQAGFDYEQGMSIGRIVDAVTDEELFEGLVSELDHQIITNGWELV